MAFTIQLFLTWLLIAAQQFPALCKEKEGPELLASLTKTEIKYAYIYWRYNVTDHVEPPGQPGKYNLKYHFMVPLTERLAGIGYVGHAARLRLVLDRVRSGEAIRVGSVGGSITSGMGVGGRWYTYATHFVFWLNKIMPPNRFSEAQLKFPLPDKESEGESEESEHTERRMAMSEQNDGSDVYRRTTRDLEEGLDAEALRNSELDPERLLAALEEAASLAGPDGAAPTDEQTQLEVEESLRRSATAGWASRRLQMQRGLRSSAPAPGPVGPPRHEYIQGSVPGTLSGYMSSCVNHHLPPGVDLVFVEYAVNDSPAPDFAFLGPNRRAFERLIRKLLRLPSRPAVVLVNMYAYLGARGKYYHNAERDFYEVATYYGLPSVSLKAAVVPVAVMGSDIKSSSSSSKPKSAVPEMSIGAIFNGGVMHPGRGGHVIVAEELMTLTLELLQSNARLRGPSKYDGSLINEELEGEVDPNKGLDPDAAKLLTAVANRPLPPPIAEGNYEATISTCYVEGDLRDLTVSYDGWNWTDEGRNKWGWVCEATGKELRLELNTQLDSRSSSKAPIILQIAYLQSYTNMGTVKVTCEYGCECDSETIDAFDPRPVSVMTMYDIQVSQSKKCIILIKTTGKGKSSSTYDPKKVVEIAESASRGNKFKLLGVVVGEEPGASEGLISYMRGATMDASHITHSVG